MDKGKKEESSKPNIVRIKRKKMENTSDQKKKEDAMERGWKRLKAENAAKLQKREEMEAAAAAAAAGNKETKEETEDSDEFEGLLEGTETEYSSEETVLSTSEELEVCKQVKGTETEDTEEEEEEEKEETILSPKESSTNNPKGMKKNVEQAAGNNQDEQLVLSPKESSPNNLTGLKEKQVHEEEEEEEEEEEILISDSLSADTLSDACTSKFPTSPIDKSMRSPPGDL